MEHLLWDDKGLRFTLTRDGVGAPCLRLERDGIWEEKEHHDYGPRDALPYGSTAAEFVQACGQAQQLRAFMFDNASGNVAEMLKAARLFLARWPGGPQLAPEFRP